MWRTKLLLSTLGVSCFERVLSLLDKRVPFGRRSHTQSCQWCKLGKAFYVIIIVVGSLE